MCLLFVEFSEGRVVYIYGCAKPFIANGYSCDFDFGNVTKKTELEFQG